jgi:hypothetical protein
MKATPIRLVSGHNLYFKKDNRELYYRHQEVVHGVIKHAQRTIRPLIIKIYGKRPTKANKQSSSIRFPAVYSCFESIFKDDNDCLFRAD